MVMRWTMKRLLVLVLSAAATITAHAAIALYTVPSDLADTDGGGANTIPFGSELQCDGGGIRYQQVYAGSEIFGGNIGLIAFRLDAGNPGDGAGIARTYEDIEVRLSTTSRTAMTLSANLTTNPGLDETLVYKGDITYAVPTAKGATTLAPEAFTLEIDPQESFVFDPMAGNLLLDIVIPECPSGGPIFFDAQSGGSATNVLGRAYSTNFGTGHTSTNFGLVTEFISSTPPPQPFVPCLSGDWYFGPSHDKEGLIIHFVEPGFLVVYWFTYDQFGNEMWLFGSTGSFVGFGPVDIDMVRYEGPSFGPFYDTGDLAESAVGTITLSWSDFDHGSVAYSFGGGLGSGVYPLTRITQMLDLPCQ